MQVVLGSLVFERRKNKNRQMNGGWLYPHDFFKPHRLPLADIDPGAVLHFYLQGTIEKRVDALDKLDIDNMLPVGSEKMRFR